MKLLINYLDFTRDSRKTEGVNEKKLKRVIKIWVILIRIAAYVDTLKVYAESYFLFYQRRMARLDAERKKELESKQDGVDELRERILEIKKETQLG